jgi:hypothetical protein
MGPQLLALWNLLTGEGGELTMADESIFRTSPSATGVTVDEAENLRKQLRSDITKLVLAYERATGMRVVGLHAGHWLEYQSHDGAMGQTRGTGIDVEVRL